MEDWEKQLHRELMELPELEAPPTLIAGVLNRIKAQAPSSWYQSPWWDWPVALRLASAVLVLGVLGFLAWFAGSFGELGLGPQLTQAYAETKTALDSVLDACEAAMGSSAVFWSNYGQMILLAAGALLFATYLTCVAAGTALYQLAWRRST